jgi:hypothetical protein
VTQRAARELRDHGTYAEMIQSAMPWAEANGLFRK